MNSQKMLRKVTNVSSVFNVDVILSICFPPLEILFTRLLSTRYPFLLHCHLPFSLLSGELNGCVPQNICSSGKFLLAGRFEKIICPCRKVFLGNR